MRWSPTIEAAEQNPDTTFVFGNGVGQSEDVASAAYRYAESYYVGGVLGWLSQQGAREEHGRPDRWFGGPADGRLRSRIRPRSDHIDSG